MCGILPLLEVKEGRFILEIVYDTLSLCNTLVVFDMSSAGGENAAVYLPLKELLYPRRV